MEQSDLEAKREELRRAFLIVRGVIPELAMLVGSCVDGSRLFAVYFEENMLLEIESKDSRVEL